MSLPLKKCNYGTILQVSLLTLKYSGDHLKYYVYRTWVDNLEELLDSEELVRITVFRGGTKILSRCKVVLVLKNLSSIYFCHNVDAKLRLTIFSFIAGENSVSKSKDKTQVHSLSLKCNMHTLCMLFTS